MWKKERKKEVGDRNSKVALIIGERWWDSALENREENR